MNNCSVRLLQPISDYVDSIFLTVPQSQFANSSERERAPAEVAYNNFVVHIDHRNGITFLYAQAIFLHKEKIVSTKSEK